MAGEEEEEEEERVREREMERSGVERVHGYCKLIYA